MTPWGFPGGSDNEESACNAGDLGSIPESGRSPEERHGNPLQNSCLANSKDRGAWWTAVHGAAKSQARLSDQHTHDCRACSLSPGTGLTPPVSWCTTPWGPSLPPGEQIPSCPHPPPLLTVAKVTSTTSSPGSLGNSHPTQHTLSLPLAPEGTPRPPNPQGPGPALALWATAPKPASAASCPAPSRSPNASESLSPLPSLHLGVPSLPS